MFGSIMASIGLASPLAIGIWLDKTLKKDIKEKAFSAIFATKSDTIGSNRIIQIYNLLSLLTRHGRSKAMFYMGISSLCAIIVVFSMQYFINIEQFNGATSTYIKNIINLDRFSLLSLLSFIFVDVIIFYKTFVFLKFGSSAKNAFELFFVAISDLVMSVFMVITILPFFILIAFYVSQDGGKRQLYYLMQTNMYDGNYNISNYVRFFSQDMIKFQKMIMRIKLKNY